MGEEDSLAKAPRREESGERRGGGFDGIDRMNKMDRRGEGEGMRFIVLIPFGKERAGAALRRDLLFCRIYST